jgi:hypothetical protein
MHSNVVPIDPIDYIADITRTSAGQRSHRPPRGVLKEDLRLHLMQHKLLAEFRNCTQFEGLQAAA